MNWSLPLSILVGLVGCKSESGPAAPVTNGSYITFAVTDSMPDGPVTHDLKLSFAQQGDLFEMRFATAGGGDEVPGPVLVDRTLVPKDNVIAAYSLGRLWLPPEGRTVGRRTPCGAVSREQKFRDWQVYVVTGLCGTQHGVRYYEKNSGMLVGFTFSGSADRLAYVKDSG